MKPLRRNLCLGIAMWWVSASPGMAQITVSSRTAFDQLLLYEPLLVELKVTNNTGTPLMLGEGGNAKLDILVERKPGYSVPDLQGTLLERPVLVKAGITKKFEVDLAKAHDIRKTGALTIIPRIRHAGRIYTGVRLLVEVVPGLEIGNYRYMVPGATGAGREGSLRTLYRGRAQRVFLKLEDTSNNISLGVFDLGRQVSQAKATMRSDGTGMLHVLHQSGPFRYTHSVFRPDGQPVKIDFLSKGNGTPRLVRDASGAVDVAGVQAYEGDPYIDRPVIKAFDPYE